MRHTRLKVQRLKQKDEKYILCKQQQIKMN